MKKTLLISASIIALTAVIAPKFVGNAFNQKLDSMLVLINQNPMYSASVKNRSNTWFSSAATIHIAFDGSAFADENTPEIQNVFSDINVDIVVDAQHGPILTQNGLSLGWLSWSARVEGDSLRDTLDFDADTPIYQITNHTNLFGKSSFHDKVPSFNMQGDEVFTQFAFSGWNGSGAFTDPQASYQCTLDRLSFEGAFGTLELNEWRVSTTIQGNMMNIMAGNFYDSSSTMQIRDISFESVIDQSTTVITTLGMEAVSDFDEKTSLLDYQINFSLNELTTADLNLSSVQVNTQVNNLKEQFFKAYQTLMNEVGTDPAKVQENLDTLMQTELLGQLQAEPEFNISSFSAKVNQGNISGSLNSKIHQVTALPDPIESPAFWIQHLMTDAQLNADDSVALWLAINLTKSQIKAAPNAAQMSDEEIIAIAQQQAPAMLQGLQQQGLLTKTNSGYQMAFSLKEGQALLNGNPMPLPTGQ